MRAPGGRGSGSWRNYTRPRFTTLRSGRRAGDTVDAALRTPHGRCGRPPRPDPACGSCTRSPYPVSAPGPCIRLVHPLSVSVLCVRLMHLVSVSCPSIRSCRPVGARLTDSQGLLRGRTHTVRHEANAGHDAASTSHRRHRGERENAVTVTLDAGAVAGTRSQSAGPVLAPKPQQEDPQRSGPVGSGAPRCGPDLQAESRLAQRFVTMP
jgi:hypothetical protein